MTAGKRFVVAFMLILAVPACSSTPATPTSTAPPEAPAGQPVALTIVSASPQAGAQLPRDTPVAFEITADYDLGAHSSGYLSVVVMASGNGSQFGYLDAGVLSQLTTSRGRTTGRFGAKFDARAAGQPLHVTLALGADGVMPTSRGLGYTISP